MQRSQALPVLAGPRAKQPLWACRVSAHPRPHPRVEAHPGVAPQLHEQADRTLRHFAYEGDLKWVSLLMWAGADPRSRGSTLDERYGDDPACYTTALEQACQKGNLQVVVRLKPDADRDNLSDLLASAAFFVSKEVLHYLLGLGATPNGRPDGGSSALDRCLSHLGNGDYNSMVNKTVISKYSAQPTLDCIREPVEHGARWRPEDRKTVNSLRQTLYKCEPSITVELMKIFARHHACPDDILEQLLDTPRMREHLSRLGMKFTVSEGPR